MTKQTEGSQNYRERVQALVREMSLEEKMGLMIHRARGIPRLGIPDYNWWNEALHGVANNGESTVFPQAIALGATFDPDLVHRVATAISLEARAKFNA
ncbi:MAG: glycoside hydrolase family 3 protein, partial [Treponemataceae bacterium]|nr:glycoside hydrolase family 3 protein [Treponemataceae bacterium]